MKKILLFCIAILLASCDQENTGADYKISNHSSTGFQELSEDMDQEPPRMGKPPKNGEQEMAQAPKIIRTGNMDFEVGNLNTAKEEIDGWLENLDGYYENETYHSYGHQNNYNLSVRIPNAKFDTLITLMESGLGTLKNKNIRAQDVSEEYTDLNIRLSNKLAVLEQYKSILKKAQTIKDILDVQEKIRRLEEEIESKKGRLKYLDNKVAYSTLQVTISQLIDRPIQNKSHFGTRLFNAFKSGFDIFLGFIIGVVHFWPFIFLFFGLYLFRNRIFSMFRRLRRK